MTEAAREAAKNAANARYAGGIGFDGAIDRAIDAYEAALQRQSRDNDAKAAAWDDLYSDCVLAEQRSIVRATRHQGFLDRLNLDGVLLRAARQRLNVNPDMVSVECDGRCVTASDLGLPYDTLANADPECSLHGTKPDMVSIERGSIPPWLQHRMITTEDKGNCPPQCCAGCPLTFCTDCGAIDDADDYVEVCTGRLTTDETTEAKQ